jgi:hypothetical protein
MDLSRVSLADLSNALYYALQYQTRILQQRQRSVLLDQQYSVRRRFLPLFSSSPPALTRSDIALYHAAEDPTGTSAGGTANSSSSTSILFSPLPCRFVELDLSLLLRPAGERRLCSARERRRRLGPSATTELLRSPCFFSLSFSLPSDLFPLPPYSAEQLILHLSRRISTSAQPTSSSTKPPSFRNNRRRDGFGRSRRARTRTALKLVERVRRGDIDAATCSCTPSSVVSLSFPSFPLLLSSSFFLLSTSP